MRTGARFLDKMELLEENLKGLSSSIPPFGEEN